MSHRGDVTPDHPGDRDLCMVARMFTTPSPPGCNVKGGDYHFICESVEEEQMLDMGERGETVLARRLQTVMHTPGQHAEPHVALSVSATHSASQKPRYMERVVSGRASMPN